MFITSGEFYSYIREQYPDASILNLGFIYPFCDEENQKICFQRQNELIVIEELDTFIEEHLKSIGLNVNLDLHQYRLEQLRLSEYSSQYCGQGKSKR
jgi:indolepyruvate ferredoxin oxidoreductase alpha subunit